MLTADADLQLRSGPPAVLDRNANQSSDTALVERLEGVRGQHALIDVVRQELAHVIATEAERHLRQVVRAK